MLEVGDEVWPQNFLLVVVFQQEVFNNARPRESSLECLVATYPELAEDGGGEKLANDAEGVSPKSEEGSRH